MGENTKRVAAEIVFHSMTETPTQPNPGRSYLESALLFNQCDGYHLVFARFDSEDGAFDGFYDWCGTERYEPDKHYCAWALLPDTVHLHGAFARPGPYQGD